MANAEKKGWLCGQPRAETILAEALTKDGQKEWVCRFCTETNVWARWRCRKCFSSIPSVLQGKCRQAVSAKGGRCSSGSSSSSGGDNKNCRTSDAEVQALREELNRFKNTEKKQGVECEPAGEEGGLEEDGKMEVDEEVDSKKKWVRKKELQKQLRFREAHVCAAAHSELAQGRVAAAVSIF